MAATVTNVGNAALILVDTRYGPKSVVLPSITSDIIGRIYTIVDSQGGADLNPITVTASQDIDRVGVRSFRITTSNANVKIVADATKWNVLSHQTTTAPAPHVFNPNTIPGLQIWADAAIFRNQLFVNNTWLNKGNSKFALQCNGTVRQNGLNSLPVMNFTVSQSMTITNSVFLLPNYSMFMVSRLTGTTNRRIFSIANEGELFGYWNGRKQVFHINGDPSFMTGSPADTAWDIVTHTRRIGGAFLMNWNGNLLHSGASSNIEPLTTFGINNSFESSDAEVAEVLIYDNVLDGGQIAKIEGYLAWKWGRQVPLRHSHPFKNQAPWDNSFSPSSVSGLNLWLDASDTKSVVSNNQIIVAVRNKGIIPFTGFVVGDPTIVYNVTNRLPAMTFNGSNQFIFFGNVLNLGTSPLYIFVVCKYNNTDGGTLIGKTLFGNATGRYALFRNSGALISLIQGGTSAVTNEASFFDSSTDARILMYAWDRSTISIWNNGTQINSASFVDTQDIISTHSLFIGAYGNNTGTAPQDGMYFNGHIMEILQYQDVITVAQRETIEGYLAAKWSLQPVLPANHPFRTAVPTNTTLFNPRNLEGINLWFDAADEESIVYNTSGTNMVSVWRDKSGNNRHAVVGGTLFSVQARPYGQNGRTFIYFPALSFASGVTSVTSNQWHFFVVASLSQTGGTFNGRIFSLASASGNDDNNVSSVVPLRRTGGGVGFIAQRNTINSTSVDVPNYSTFFIMHTTENRGNMMSGVNGQIILTSRTSPIQNLDVTRFAFAISAGDQREGTDFEGGIAEAILFNRALSQEDYQRVEGYLAWKWGLQSFLPTVHPARFQNPVETKVEIPQLAGTVLPTSVSSRFSNLVLWLDAADTRTLVTNTEGNLVAWRDKSRSGNDFLTPTAIFPTVVNELGSQVVNIPRGAVMQSSIAINKIPNSHIFIVARSIHSNGVGMLFGSSHLNSDHSIQYVNGELSSVLSSNNIVTATNTFINGTRGTAPGIYQSYHIISVRFASLVNNTTLSLSSSFMSQFFIGRIAEVVIFTSINDDDRIRFEGYLAWKWNLSHLLPQPHDFKRYTPSLSLEFLPNNIAGLDIWIDATSFTQPTGTSLPSNSWPNKGLWAYSVSCNGIIRQNALNGLPVVSFNENQTLTISPTIDPPGYTMFFVARHTGGRNQRIFTTSSPFNQLFGYHGGNKRVFFIENNPSLLSGIPADTLWDISSHSRTPNDPFIMFWNGSLLHRGSTSTNLRLENFGVNNYSFNERSNCEVAELLIYESILNVNQIKQVEGYLACKWGLVSNLPVNHPYRFSSFENPIPGSISGLNLWLDAADNQALVRTAAGNLVTWRDKSRSGNNFTTNTGTFPSVVIEATRHQYVDIPNGAIMRSIAPYNLTSDTFIFIVALNSKMSDFSMLFATDHRSSDYSIRYFGGALFSPPNDWDIAQLTNTFISGTRGIPAGGYQQYTIISVRNPITYGNTNLQLSSSTMSRFFIGRVAEVLIYEGIHESDRLLIEGYLAHKWDIQNRLPLTHPHFTIPAQIRAEKKPLRNTFIPTSISGISLWLDANDNQTLVRNSGGGLLTWRDKSGLANNFNTNTATLPTIAPIATGLQNVNIPNGAVMRSVAAENFRVDTWIFIVAANSKTNDFSMLFATDHLGSDYSIRYGNGIISAPNNNDIAQITRTFINGTRGIPTGGIPNVPNSQYQQFHIISTRNFVGHGNSNIQLSSSFISRFFIGGIAEVLIYYGISDGERQQIEGYLAHKWNLVTRLPSNHPYRFNSVVTRVEIQPLLGTFLPSSIGGLNLWLDANDDRTLLRNHTGQILTWNDKSGSGNNFIRTGSANVDSLSNDGLTRNLSVASGAILQSTALTNLTTDTWIFIVALNSNMGTFSMLLGTNHLSSDYSIRYSNGNLLSGSVQDIIRPTNTFINGTLGVPSGIYQQFHIIAVRNPTAAGNVNLTLSSAFLSRFFIGRIAEVLIYQGLADGDRQLIEAYLANKWNIRNNILPLNHPYRFSLAETSIPSSINSLALWLDAADNQTLVTNAGNLLTWRDKSTRGNNFSTATATFPTVVTEGTNQYVNIPSGAVMQSTATNNLTRNTAIFIVARITTITSFAYMLGSSHNSSNYSIMYSSGVLVSSTSTLRMASEEGTWINGNPTIPTSGYTNYHMISLIHPNAVGNTNLSLSSSFLSSFFVGRIAELLVYDNIMQGDRERIETYLARKWGLLALLPANHVARNIKATGGIIVNTDSTVYHVFTSNGIFAPILSGFTVNYLIVGGGGGGGDRHGGGGGAGELRSDIFISSDTERHNITIGGGGIGGNYEANNSSPQGAGLQGGTTTFGTFIAYGGGGGGTFDGNPNPVPRGSGGGGGGRSLAGVLAGFSGTQGGSGQQPGAGGGGGSASAGLNANNGIGGNGSSDFSARLLAAGYGNTFASGSGFNNPISGGVARIAAGGGGASSDGSITAIAGGLGGGGTGSWNTTPNMNGTPNTGSGGGGSRSNNEPSSGANGGSGLVLIWYT